MIFAERTQFRPWVGVVEMSKNFCPPDMIHSSTRMGLMPEPDVTAHLPYSR